MALRPALGHKINPGLKKMRKKCVKNVIRTK